MKDPKNWPKKMQEEWDGDEGMAFAAEYQRILQPAYRKARECIDEFKPDFVSFLVTTSMRFSKKKGGGKRHTHLLKLNM